MTHPWKATVAVTVGICVSLIAAAGLTPLEVPAGGSSRSPQIAQDAVYGPHPDVLGLEARWEAEALAERLQAIQWQAEYEEHLRLVEVERQAAARPVVRQGGYAPSGKANCQDGTVRAVLAPIFGEHTDHALNIVSKESGCTDTAYNPSGASGLFQIMMPMHSALVAGICGSADLVWEPGCNAQVAWALSSSGSNWQPWAASGG